MNPDFRKVALIAASLGLLVSLFFALRQEEEPGRTVTTLVTTAPEPSAGTPALTMADTNATATFTVRVPAEVAPKKQLVVALGRVVSLVVESARVDEAHVHGYDLRADVAPGAPATLTFTADAAGRFELELEESGVGIAEIEVRP